MTQKNDWLQVLRAVAALAVLFHHMAPHWQTSAQLAFTTPWMHWGFAGVDVFFVLSGYVVYQSADKASHVWNAFLLRRALRIYLGYWPVLALTALLAAVTHRWPSASVMTRSALLLQPNLFENWVPTAWSLTYELYFYLWVALVCLFAPRWRLPVMAVAAVALLAWNLGWYVLAYEVVYGGQQPWRFTLTGLGAEFLAGAIWAHVRRRHAWLGSARLAPWFLALGALLLAYGFGVGSLSPMYDRVEGMRAITFGVAGFGALLVALALADRGWRAPAGLVRLGDASYGLYLLHPLLLSVMGYLRFHHVPHTSWAQNLFLLLMPVGIGAVSLLWFRWVERPLFERTAASAWVRRWSRPLGR